MSDRLDDEIRDLCHDIKRSDLYHNRPKVTTAGSALPAALSGARMRQWISERSLAAKSRALKERRAHYLQDKNMEKMRNVRTTLPVYTRSSELLKQIHDNEVTICLAATGSGKTTQIPQLILDDMIDKGEGAKCNIVCTQPRRLAAIGVADRVAKERGETLGRTVGYQVRFEHKLPEEHGSITFCTTGIFLKRMQSALFQPGTTLDDVTHILVDEVHERDVDTDLLLVVLKRLIADRKDRGKPIKVVLMSATIDPTLFQQYFADEDGKPASVIEVPGRSFPVTKYFMDDFVPTLAQKQSTRWVFRQDSVINYLASELGPEQLRAMGVPSPVDDRIAQQEQLELPVPLIALTISHVLQQTDDGHVLVFLPGWEDIQAVQRCLLDSSNQLGMRFSDSSKYNIHVLHSTVPLSEQQVIFEPPPAGIRRIILSTNIAETSITIPDVVYVVDTGKIKEQRYDPERHMSSLVSAWVGSSNLNQRAGRAGRHRSGEYFGILGQKRAAALSPYQTVEMKRVDLSNVVMHIKALDFPNMAVDEVLAATIEPPAAARVDAAMEDLQRVGALDAEENLTALGRVLLQLPVDAQMGRLVLYGCFFRCLDQALTLAALLSNRDPFVSPMHLKQEAAAKKLSWSPTEFRSDALAALRAYNAWWNMHGKGEYSAANRFCSDNFLSKPTLLMVQKIKNQLLQSLYHVGVIGVSAGGDVAPPRGRDNVVPEELNTNGGSLPLLAGLIAIAAQPNFAVRTGEKSLRTQQDKMVFIHPSSVNNRKHEVSAGTDAPVEKQLYAFAEKRQNVSSVTSGPAQKYLVTTTRLDPMTYVLFGAHKIVVAERGLECDEWLPIVGNVDALDDIQRLKYLMEECFLRVFAGITSGRRHQHTRAVPIPPPPRDAEEEEESGSEDDESKDYSLTKVEIAEFDQFTRDIVRVLNRYNEERIQTQSRQNSRPGTPMGSPLSSPSLGGLSRLPSFAGSRSAFNSRPGTPSPLARRP
ncbi:P-loop containing nucleoside triphosphate hydrolase protein [Punctularia strigosozonata HHB-11173 SS5]|uniref:P-loop containing nucleoside triphosphate hydrolase protein n=1 Tax=Punctularia strigosozonata (strain HHB-11173) TaxID=741275 RepID=UPI000441822B|nr:P-loop containing nucleoside triphosphate hydrolase protein [Punctularia strigosozonata HHB-11173 SS5]EIN13744.1 P-loop containing nucleoside triphosphate hydrolase protein [Punctularia strigosozonata HHB-11173 SS5]